MYMLFTHIKINIYIHKYLSEHRSHLDMTGRCRFEEFKYIYIDTNIYRYK
jgi:hypothetical protein